MCNNYHYQFLKYCQTNFCDFLLCYIGIVVTAALDFFVSVL
jgi:hypothetical protein